MATLVLMVWLSGCQAGPGSSEPIAEAGAVKTVAEQLAARLEAELGRAAIPATVIDNRLDDWRVVCGQPQEPTGGPFDYNRSALAGEAAAGLVDDSFCALFQHEAAGPILREFSLGTTDAPVFDWMERYDLPSGLFSE
jgi:hypothetical protein